MPAKDIFHDTVKHALVKDGWEITHDPYVMKWGKRDLFVDLGAEKILAAEKEGKKIAIEVKSFVGPSEIADLKNAFGQYILYDDVLKKTEPERALYLAIRQAVYIDLFEEPIGELLLEKERVQLIIFDHKAEEIVKWIP